MQAFDLQVGDVFRSTSGEVLLATRRCEYGTVTFNVFDYEPYIVVGRQIIDHDQIVLIVQGLACRCIRVSRFAEFNRDFARHFLKL